MRAHEHACDVPDLDYSEVGNGKIRCTVCPRMWRLTFSADGKAGFWNVTPYMPDSKKPGSSGHHVWTDFERDPEIVAKERAEIGDARYERQKARAEAELAERIAREEYVNAERKFDRAAPFTQWKMRGHLHVGPLFRQWEPSWKRNA